MRKLLLWLILYSMMNSYLKLDMKLKITGKKYFLLYYYPLKTKKYIIQFNILLDIRIILQFPFRMNKLIKLLR